MNNRRMPAVLEGDFSSVVLNSLNRIISSNDDPVALVAIVHELSVSERTSPTREEGSCRIELEIARVKDSTYYSLGTYLAEVTRGGFDVTATHGVRIREALEMCLKEFNSTNWQENQGAAVEEVSQVDCNIILEELPELGFYPSFSTLCLNEPMETFPHEIREITNDVSLIRFTIKAENREDRNRMVMFVADRGKLFMHASRYNYGKYFIAAKHMGRFIYFEDMFTDSGAAIAFGLIGAAISTQRRGIILDTTNGQVSILTFDRATELLRKSLPEGVRYLKPLTTREDREEAILWLNSQYIGDK